MYHVEMHPLEILSGTLRKWIGTAKTMAGRMSATCRELEETRDENPEKAEKLIEMLSRFTAPIPKMTEIMEKAMKDMQELTREKK